MQTQEKPQDSLEGGDKPQKTSTLESHGLYRLGLAYGRQVYRFRWFIIALWIIIVGVSIPFASQISSALQGGGYSFKDSESIRVDNLLTSKLHQPLTQALVIFQSTNMAVSDPAYQQEVRDFMSRTRSFPNVTQVTQGGTGQDGRTTYVMVNFNQPENKIESQVEDFHKLLPSGPAASPAKVYLSGDPAIFRATCCLWYADRGSHACTPRSCCCSSSSGSDLCYRLTLFDERLRAQYRLYHWPGYIN